MPKRSAAGLIRNVKAHPQVSRDLDGTIGDDDVIIMPRKK